MSIFLDAAKACLDTLKSIFSTLQKKKEANKNLLLQTLDTFLEVTRLHAGAIQEVVSPLTVARETDLTHVNSEYSKLIHDQTFPQCYGMTKGILSEESKRYKNITQPISDFIYGDMFSFQSLVFIMFNIERLNEQNRRIVEDLDQSAPTAEPTDRMIYVNSHDLSDLFDETNQMIIEEKNGQIPAQERFRTLLGQFIQYCDFLKMTVPAANHLISKADAIAAQAGDLLQSSKNNQRNLTGKDMLDIFRQWCLCWSNAINWKLSGDFTIRAGILKVSITNL